MCDTIVHLGKYMSMLASLSSYTFLLNNNKYFNLFSSHFKQQTKKFHKQRMRAWHHTFFLGNASAYNFITSIIMVTWFALLYGWVWEKRKK